VLVGVSWSEGALVATSCSPGIDAAGGGAAAVDAVADGAGVTVGGAGVGLVVAGGVGGAGVALGIGVAVAAIVGVVAVVGDAAGGRVSVGAGTWDGVTVAIAWAKTGWAGTASATWAASSSLASGSIRRSARLIPEKREDKITQTATALAACPALGASRRVSHDGPFPSAGASLRSKAIGSARTAGTCPTRSLSL
jgi:hypothetical protein